MRLNYLAIALCFWGGCLAAQTTLLGSYVWEVNDPKFGGLSGLELSDDGADLFSVGDHGISLEARVTRDGSRITSVELIALRDLRSPSGDKLIQGTTDSEGLARDADGTIYVSFEGKASRIVRDASHESGSTILPAPHEFNQMQLNSGLEALAVDQYGTVYTIPERSGRANRPFPIYRFRNDTWDIPATLPRTGPYLVVGADFGPDGLMYVLERDFTGFGFRSRVRRIAIDSGRVETILETGALVHGNLEGISLWVNEAGETIMTMIADDNFSRFQQTEVVEYRIDS